MRLTEVSKCIKFPPLNFVTWSMRRRIQAFTDVFLVTVTEGEVHDVYKVVTLSSFGVTRWHKESGGR